MPEGHLGAAACGLLPPTCAAKVEYCWLRCRSPQEGQANCNSSDSRRISFSNFVSQLSHLYSYMGMTQFTSSLQILSITSRMSAAGPL